MVYLPIVAAAVVLALALGGRLGALAAIQLRAAWLFYTSRSGSSSSRSPPRFFHFATDDRLASAIWLGSYACLLVAAVANLRLRGVWIVLAGIIVQPRGGRRQRRRHAGAARGRTRRGHGRGQVQQRAERRSAPLLARRPVGGSGLDPARQRLLRRDVVLAVGAFVLIMAAMDVPLLRHARRRMRPRRRRERALGSAACGPSRPGQVASFLQAASAERLEEFSEGTPTAPDAAKAVGCELGQIVKSLVVVCDGRPVVAMIPGEPQADARRVRPRRGRDEGAHRDAGRGSVRDGLQVGAVAPFPLPGVDHVSSSAGRCSRTSSSGSAPARRATWPGSRRRARPPPARARDRRRRGFVASRRRRESAGRSRYDPCAGRSMGARCRRPRRSGGTAS